MPVERPTVSRILIVDDHVVLREGLASLLAGQPDFEIVGEAGTVAEAIVKVAELEPDIVLMDYGLPDGTGVEATREVLARWPETNIVFLTVHETDDELFGAIRSGAKGYLLKNVPVSEMLKKLRGLARGEAPISGQMVSRILAQMAREQHTAALDDELLGQLTPRELEVLQEIARGATNQEIAESLYISINTVKNHVHNILKKLEVKNRHGAAKLAADRGLT